MVFNSTCVSLQQFSCTIRSSLYTWLICHNLQEIQSLQDPIIATLAGFKNISRSWPTIVNFHRNNLQATCTTTWKLFHDMTWRDMTWRDVTWRGVTWRDMTWRDMTWELSATNLRSVFCDRKSHCWPRIVFGTLDSLLNNCSRHIQTRCRDATTPSRESGNVVLVHPATFTVVDAEWQSGSTTNWVAISVRSDVPVRGWVILRTLELKRDRNPCTSDSTPWQRRLTTTTQHIFSIYQPCTSETCRRDNKMAQCQIFTAQTAPVHHLLS